LVSFILTVCPSHSCVLTFITETISWDWYLLSNSELIGYSPTDWYFMYVSLVLSTWNMPQEISFQSIAIRRT
jgi:hypothetical protein